MAKDLLERIQFNNGKFPEAELREIIKNKEEYIPKLLDVLDYAYENPEKIEEDQDYFAHIYASYLLAQFREPRAHSKIAKLVSLPGDMAYNIYGDTITEDLPSLLASTYDGDDSLIKGLIEDESIDEYVRGSAISSLTILAIYNMKTRDEIIEYFKTLFKGKLNREQSSAWSSLINECCDLRATELYEDIKLAFEENLIDLMSIGLEDVDDSFELSIDSFSLEDLKFNKHNTLITDTISDLKGWVAFNQNKYKKDCFVTSKGQNEQVEIKETKTGRNDPCPCGSGKKYKKCCGK